MNYYIGDLHLFNRNQTNEGILLFRVISQLHSV